MELLTAKAISLAAVFLISGFFGLLPLKFSRTINHTIDHNRKRCYRRVLSFLSCYGGGVFFGACLLDLFPDVQTDFKAVLKELNIQTSFPIPEFVVALGFFIVLTIEQIVLSWKENASMNFDRVSERARLVQSEDRQPIPNYSSIGNSDIPTTSTNHGHEDEHSIVFSVHEDPSSHSNLRMIMLLLALSLHSVFEGFAIGLQSIIEHLVQLLIAIMIHKGIIALSLGVNLVQSKLKLRMKLISIFIFSVASPLGIGIGMGISDNPQLLSVKVLCAVLQGLACGTFLYVTFFEVLPHEMNHKRDRELKLLFIILGFATIIGALFLDSSQGLI